MPRILRHLPQIGLVLLAALAIWATAYGLKHLQMYQPFADIIGQQNGTGQLDLEVHDARAAGRSHGRPVWRLKAAQITFTQDQETVSVDGIRDGVLCDSAGRDALSISAGHADFSNPMGLYSAANFGVLSLSGGIAATVRGRNGPQFSCNSLVWHVGAGSADVPGSVQIAFPNGSGRAVAQNIHYDTKARILTLQSLRGTFRVSRLVK
jgi:hypothetical protein